MSDLQRLGMSVSSRGARPFGGVAVRLEFEQVAGLAIEGAANRVERGEADRARLAGLQDRQVGKRDVDPFGEFGQGHPPVVQQILELDGDGHQIVPSKSSLISVPSANTRARTKVRIPANQPLVEKPASR